jgi:tRNA dimethylallyltransferase
VAHVGVAIVGPTAAGKSSVALEVARQTGSVEIVSVDSMAVYREMDLATAKPTKADRAEVPHHLIDILDPSEECTVSLFQDQARRALRGITERGHVPLLVGGTGLYHRAVIDDLTIPAQYPEVRAALNEVADRPGGLAELYERLVLEDPTAAGRIEPENQRRVVRALEVIDGSGQRFSSFGPGLDQYRTSSIIQIGIDAELAELDAAVALRVQGWMDEGLVDEIDRLAIRPSGMARTARQAIGYRELLDWRASGGEATAPISEPVAATITRTMQLVRRQRAWFRRDPRVRWARDAQEAEALLVEAIGQVATSRVRD